MTAPFLTLPVASLTPKQLREFRTQHGISLVAVADGTGMGATQIRMREQGKVEIDQSFIARFNNFALNPQRKTAMTSTSEPAKVDMTSERLKAFIERIERLLENEKKGRIAEDIKEVLYRGQEQRLRASTHEARLSRFAAMPDSMTGLNRRPFWRRIMAALGICRTTQVSFRPSQTDADLEEAHAGCLELARQLKGKKSIDARRTGAEQRGAIQCDHQRNQASEGRG